MNGWQRWKQAPQTLWLRRFLFQVHLWLGIALGLYVLLISVSGSAVVLRPQFTPWFIPSQVESAAGEALAGAELQLRLAEVYNDYASVEAIPSTIPERALYVVLERDGAEYTRFFDQYRGEDLGSSYPWPVRSIEWLTRFHDDLLLGRAGRKLNGIGGALFLVMVFTGLFLWWPGRARWKSSLIISRGSPRRLMWQLHSVFGFWTFFLMFAWGLTGIYFAFPAPFDFIINAFDADLNDFDRPEDFLLFLIDLHFGRFGGLWGRSLWIVLGLLPAVMFLSGLVLWWRRVIRAKP